MGKCGRKQKVNEGGFVHAKPGWVSLKKYLSCMKNKFNITK